MLELNTKQTREKVKIDGIEFDLLSSEDLDLKDYLFLKNQGQKILGLKAEDINTEEQLSKLTDTLDELVIKILFAPKDIIAKLKDMQKLQIIDFFLKTRKKSSMRKAKKSPLDSNVSTEAIPNNG
jgi:hypothetical protein